MKQKNEIVLLLTATFDPNGTVFTKLNDPKLRIQQYKEALEFYTTFNTKIVFVENSCTDEALQKSLSTQFKYVEFLFFKGNNENVTKGKGAGEAELIEFALNHAQYFIQNHLIIKITGRIIITNFDKILQYYTRHSTPYIALLAPYKNFAYSNIIIFTSNFFSKYFFPLAHEIDDQQGINFEHVLYKAILHAQDENKPMKIIRILPKFRGISASTGLEISNSHRDSIWKILKHELKFFIFQSKTNLLN